jgi:hypothetical protein
VARAAAFDYLVGDTDRHEGNWMVRADGKLVLIDNGLSFAKYDNPSSGNYALLHRAKTQTMDIPEELRGESLASKWAQVEAILNGWGFDDDEVLAVRGRLEDLTRHTNFRDLLDDPDSRLKVYRSG